MKKKVCAFSIADKNNMKYYERMQNSLRKFHTAEELPLLLWEEAKIQSYNDPAFFYRATPIIARQLLKDYDLVIKLDADQIITGDLNHIIDDPSYDVACPLNWNRVDPQVYGPVGVIDVPPVMYLNCGLVAMRNREFVEKWFRLCHSVHFNAFQYKEQDLLNIMAFYFDWKVKNLDAQDTWNGLISKGEMMRFELKNNGQPNSVLVVPPAADHFPDKEMIVKVIHLAGGNNAGDKFDYLNTHTKPEILAYLQGLIK
jgi:hypothetical protein